MIGGDMRNKRAKASDRAAERRARVLLALLYDELCGEEIFSEATRRKKKKRGRRPTTKAKTKCSGG
jgi:hypothetical protein